MTKQPDRFALVTFLVLMSAALLSAQFFQGNIQSLSSTPISEKNFTSLRFTDPNSAVIGYLSGDSVLAEIQNHTSQNRDYLVRWHLGKITRLKRIAVESGTVGIIYIDLPKNATGRLVVVIEKTNLEIHAVVR